MVSRRVLEAEEAERAAKELWAVLEVGQVRTGTVVSVQPFGAFVELGGVQGLVPRSRLGDDVHSSLEPGRSLSLRVIGVDKEAGKVTLEPIDGPKKTRRGKRGAQRDSGSLGTFADLFSGKL